MTSEQASDERTGPATAEQIEAAWTDPKLANVLYHDWEAATYDEKWSISYDERCIDYARDRFSHVAGHDGWPYASALELGCGTGFFLLNLKQAGVLDEGHVTDLSPGMVEVAVRNLVVGHAVLHHIPDLDLAMREVLRVLKPGGRFVFAGEPTEKGDFVARRLSRATWWAATKVTHLQPFAEKWARPQAELEESSRAAALESVVDIHTFDPDRLAALCMRAGAIDVRTVTEELTASWFGWPVRTFEAAVRPGALGWNWAMFAYKGWLRLSWLDENVLSRVVPDELFYNVCVTGTKPRG